MTRYTQTLPSEILSCRIASEEYGINILDVQEIRGYDKVTVVPNSPEHVKGVINLRGIIVPIIDLRIKFGVVRPIYDALTVVIIINLSGGTVGVVVDSVSDVVSLADDQIKPAPDIGRGANNDYLLGLAALEERMLILIDMERVISAMDMTSFEKLAA